MWIKIIYPNLIKLIDKIDKDIGKSIAIVLTVFLVLDIMLTGLAINRARDKEKGIDARYKYEEVLDKTFNKEYLKNMYNNSWGD